MEAAQTRTWRDVSDRRLRDDALPPQLQRSFTGERASKIDVPSLWRHIQEDLKLSLLPKVHQPGVEQWPWGLVEEWILSLTFTELIPACTVYVHLYKYTCVYNKKLFIITCVASLWPVCPPPPFSLRPSSLDRLYVFPARCLRDCSGGTRCLLLIVKSAWRHIWKWFSTVEIKVDWLIVDICRISKCSQFNSAIRWKLPGSPVGG